MLAHSTAPTQTTITLPLDCIIDLVNNIYVFSDLSQSIGDAFSEQFRIARKIADSGPWWRTCYGLWFHAAIKQIVARADEVPLLGGDGTAAQLDPAEAAECLPVVGVVQEILALWRRPDQPEQQRKAAVLAFFPQDVRRIIEPAGDAPLTQFHEEGHVGRGRAVLSFFAYLDQCPLPDTGDAPITLRQAVQYWGWIDHVKAFRTFFREEAVRNVRVRRMQQALQLHWLVERVRATTGVELGAIELAGEQLGAFLDSARFEQVALIADSYGMNPLIDLQEQIFIRHSSLGAAIRELLRYLPPRPAAALDDPATYASILRATAENISNHDRLLEQARLMDGPAGSIDERAVYVQLLQLAERLETIAERGAERSLNLFDSELPWCDWLDPLIEASALVAYIAAQDAYSAASRAGLELILAEVDLLAVS